MIEEAIRTAQQAALKGWKTRRKNERERKRRIASSRAVRKSLRLQEERKKKRRIVCPTCGR